MRGGISGMANRQTFTCSTLHLAALVFAVSTVTAAGAESNARADVNGDGIVDGRDVAAVATCIGKGKSPKARPDCVRGDVDGNGRVDQDDLAVVRDEMRRGGGKPPGPPGPVATPTPSLRASDTPVWTPTQSLDELGTATPTETVTSTPTETATEDGLLSLEVQTDKDVYDRLESIRFTLTMRATGPLAVSVVRADVGSLRVFQVQRDGSLIVPHHLGPGDTTSDYPVEYVVSDKSNQVLLAAGEFLTFDYPWVGESPEVAAVEIVSIYLSANGEEVADVFLLDSAGEYGVTFLYDSLEPGSNRRIRAYSNEVIFRIQ